MNNKGKGLLALLGIGAGAFAFWKYKNMTPAEKQNLKNKVNNTGQRIKETAQDVEASISDKYDKLKNSTKQEINDITR
ncbi:YtxH domain-containing protein [Aequorivita echinoideorum]|uniref:YtxH domain-containing protein n=1 Tax=Aequorivita echinoideorum TaxID=1549647 RepID=A0ABS5S4Q2_9FLAO|nr:YtxH domain-containing protein [Aequorivita echinoideorum]MBT0607953.1 YtxH domain-containing protein [Aequorivita echinoideorum]